MFHENVSECGVQVGIVFCVCRDVDAAANSIVTESKYSGLVEKDLFQCGALCAGGAFEFVFVGNVEYLDVSVVVHPD